jgi:[acyl-carrier-protein] S-malonyltransferase
LSALLFPGQGAQDMQMLETLKDLPVFLARYEVVCQHINADPLRELANNNRAFLNQNKVSSLLTVLVSSVAFDLYRDSQLSVPQWFAGYSVGQWTALYAAGCLDFNSLVEIVAARAEMMDQAVAPDLVAMASVIGLPSKHINEITEQIRSMGEPIWISNYNAPSQCTVAGSRVALTSFEKMVLALNPKKLVRLAVPGAWHCPLLTDAAARFELMVRQLILLNPQMPVIDNRTGSFLPAQREELNRTLSLHLSEPVLWETGIRNLIAQGCREFVEIGFGTILSRFGLFIDRRLQHQSFYDKFVTL